ncbi:MAG: hypothetical protein Q9216_001324 [Gyalolechia sp. 2 TL-2023]
MLFPLFHFSILVLTYFPNPIAAACYYPNGTAQTNDEVQPCDPSAPTDGFSMCCATNRNSSNPGPDEFCQENGLCGWFDPTDSANETWRSTCTDASWESPNCVKFCIEGTEERRRDRSTTEAQVTPCGDGTYCCGANQIDCCVRRQGVFLVNGTTSASLPTSTSSTISSDPQSSTLPAEASSTTTNLPNPPPEEPQPSNTTGAKIGAAVGATIGCILLFSALTFGIRQWRRMRKRERMGQARAELSAAGQDGSPKVGSMMMMGGMRSEPFVPVEVDGRAMVAELEDERARWRGELGGRPLRAELR